MLLMNRTALLGLTMIAALGIGFMMQYVIAPRTADGPPPPLEVTDIKLTAAPVAPDDGPVVEPKPVAPILASAGTLGSLVREPEPAPAEAAPAEAATPECAIGMTADPGPAAMVALSLRAACLPATRVTFHHNGMMFSEMTDGAGRVDLTVPAMSSKAVFIASFPSGDGAVATLDVASLGAYDRIVVQWQGDTGLGIHAREFDAAYWSEGHIRADAPGSARDAAAGASGLLTLLGRSDLPEPLLAEVYTFPTRMTERSGAVRLSVEAEVTGQNCGRQIDAQTIEYRRDAGLKVQDLTLFMPACETVGDFLVLKNLLEDLTIAAR